MEQRQGVAVRGVACVSFRFLGKLLIHVSGRKLKRMLVV